MNNLEAYYKDHRQEMLKTIGAVPAILYVERGKVVIAALTEPQPNATVNDLYENLKEQLARASAVLLVPKIGDTVIAYAK